MNYQSKEIKALRILNQNLFDLSVNPLATVNFNEKNDAFDVIEDAVEKYVKHKEIEEELGIELEILFKALKQGFVWIKTKQGIQKATIGAFSLKNLKVVMSYDMSEGGWNFHKNMHLTDFNKTWALTKEELL